MKKNLLIVILALVGAVGCAASNAANHRNQMMASLRSKCDSGVPSACTDLQTIQAACTGHKDWMGGEDFSDTMNCGQVILDVGQSEKPANNTQSVGNQ
jgi:hypothetical protein